MKIGKAKLVKLSTEDKHWNIHDHVKIGKIYDVDLDSTCELPAYNVDFDDVTKRKMIMVEDLDGSYNWFPLELLEIIDDKVNREETSST